MVVRECVLVTQWSEFLSHEEGVNEWYLRVCFTLVSFRYF